MLFNPISDFYQNAEKNNVYPCLNKILYDTLRQSYIFYYTNYNAFDDDDIDTDCEKHSDIIKSPKLEINLDELNKIIIILHFHAERIFLHPRILNLEITEKEYIFKIGSYRASSNEIVIGKLDKTIAIPKYALKCPRYYADLVMRSLKLQISDHNLNTLTKCRDNVKKELDQYLELDQSKDIVKNQVKHNKELLESFNKDIDDLEITAKEVEMMTKNIQTLSRNQLEKMTTVAYLNWMK